MITGYSNTISVTTLALLDAYPSAAAAYSLRLLRSAYTGSAIRVRRSSDNTEQDIGFDAFGNLDTTSLTSFCGSGDGFVTTWYDQSGNGYNATQATAANQPQIVSSGSVILENGKPSLQYDGSNDRLTTSSISQYENQLQLSLIAVSRYNTTTANMTFGANNNGMTNGFADDNLFYETNIIKFNNRSSSGTAQTTSISANTNQQYLQFVSILSNSSQSLSVNGNNTISTGLSIATPTSNNSCSIGSRADSVAYLDGKIQELVLYLSNNSSNRTGIESNINAYYGIY